MKMTQIVLGVLISLAVLATAAASETMLIKLPYYESPGQLWLDVDGNLKGFRVDVLQALNTCLKNEQIRLEYKISKSKVGLPIKRAIHGILAGQYDAYFGLIYSKQRENMGLRYSQQQLYSIPTVVWMKKDASFEYTGIESFTGRRIGVVLGYPYFQDIANPEFTIDNGAPNDESNVKKLIAGRVDAIVDNLPRTGHAVIKLGVTDQIRYAEKPFEITKFRIAYNRHVPELVIEKIDTAVTQLHESGVIRAILKKQVYNPLR